MLVDKASQSLYRLTHAFAFNSLFCSFLVCGKMCGNICLLKLTLKRVQTNKNIVHYITSSVSEFMNYNKACCQYFL